MLDEGLYYLVKEELFRKLFSNLACELDYRCMWDNAGFPLSIELLAIRGTILLYFLA